VVGVIRVPGTPDGGTRTGSGDALRSVTTIGVGPSARFCEIAVISIDDANVTSCTAGTGPGIATRACLLISSAASHTAASDRQRRNFRGRSLIAAATATSSAGPERPRSVPW
jgi:hypothetical protein